MSYKNNSKTDLLVILITAILSVLFAGQIEYWLPENANMDFNKYLDMAKAFPGINTNVIKPFVYRIISPWLAGLLPFSIAVNFYLLNFISLILFSYVIYFFLKEHSINSTIALFLTICFQLNRYFFQFLAWDYFHLTDSLSYVVLFYSFILLRKKKWLQLFLILPLGILVKEYVILIVPAGYAYLILNKYSKNELIKFTLLTIFMFIVFLGIRVLIKAEGGESLFTQYTTQVIYYSNPVALAKRFIIPFTPFGLIPIFFYRETYLFFKKHQYLFIYFLTVLSITFFGEPERLIAPLAPVYFIFLGFLIQKIFTNRNFTYSKRLTLYLITALSFLSSFYHIWGVLKLPNRETTLVITIAVNLLGLILFLILKYSIRENSKYLTNKKI